MTIDNRFFVVGMAATAVVSIGVGAAAAAATTTAAVAATAATIAGYATITAAIAAGVNIKLEMWKRFYPHIEATEVGGTVYAKWDANTKKSVLDIVDAQRKADVPKIFFRVTKYNVAGPVQIDLTHYYTQSQMSYYMQTNGWSSLTVNKVDARSVIARAFSGYNVVLDSHGLSHYHAEYANKQHVTAGPSNYVVHSFFII